MKASNNFSIKRIDTSILVAKAEPFSCEVLETLLEREGFNVLGHATELNELIMKIKTKKPKCVIVETDILGAKIEHLIAETATDKNQPKFVLYVNSRSLDDVSLAMYSNFNGYLHTGDCLKELFDCINSIDKNTNKYYSQGFRNLIKDLGVASIDSKTLQQLNRLSKRERQIIKLITEGLGSYDMALRLGVSVITMANHRQNIVKKLELEGTKELLQYALKVRTYVQLF